MHTAVSLTGNGIQWKENCQLYCLRWVVYRDMHEFRYER